MKIELDRFLPFRHRGSRADLALDPVQFDDIEQTWERIPHLFRASVASLPARWEEIFGPLRAGKIDDLMVAGQIGQSLDGRVATATGRSHYINCPAALEHLHLLRALVDAVVVGVETACRDDPQLTVRRDSGPNPVRVVVDPRGRLPHSARLCSEQGRTIVVSAGTSAFRVRGVETISLRATDGQISPASILVALAELGLRRVLVEGGANTLSRFVQTGCLDRLHIMVAPLILGAGRPSFAFGAVDRIEEALHPSARAHRLGNDILFDCDLSAQRVPVWRARAKKSLY
jgi:diaminohydroxyphosphoribosylaminopyrimidine deaminase / 5-amino-6-(5-phosphoribosylamino)uracil reductase